MLNGRYQKVIKLGQGSFNVVYLAKDLLPDGQSRLLSQKHLDMIPKLPSKNPYTTAHGYYDDEPMETEEEKVAKAALAVNEEMLPNNDCFEGAEHGPHEPAKLVVIKKQRQVMDLNGLEFYLLREIKLLQELNHPNIVKLHDVFHLNGLLYFALEYGAVDLGDLIQKHRDKIILKPEHVKCIMKQMLEGVNYLHKNWIMHRDLKPNNVVIDEKGILKLIDFNSGKIFGSPSW